MLGALGKAFGSTGKAIGKGAKTAAKGMGSRIRANMQNRPPAGVGGGIGTDPSPSFMSRFGQAMPGITNALSTMGQPQSSQPQQSMGGGMMGGMSPLIQRLLAKYQQPTPTPDMPTPAAGMPQTDMPMPGGIDVGPTMGPQMMMNRRMHGMY